MSDRDTAATWQPCHHGRTMFCEPREARAFIRRQMGDYLLLGITTMTAKQAARLEREEVVAAGRKAEAAAMQEAASRFYGRPPHGRTGRMRLLSMRSGEIQHSVAVSAAHA